jgi:hypothetical protein
MVAEVRVENGYIVNYDENGSRIRDYGGPNITQILAVNGNRVAAFSGDSGGGIVHLYHDGNLVYNISVAPIENAQISGNTLIVRFKNGTTSEYDERGNFLNNYYST